MSFVLLRTDVDGSNVQGQWNHKPSINELQYCIGGQWEEEKETKCIQELLSNGQHDMDDSASTSYDLSYVY